MPSWAPMLLSLRMNISFAYTIFVQIFAPHDSGLSFHLVVSLVYVFDTVRWCAVAVLGAVTSNQLSAY